MVQATLAKVKEYVVDRYLTWRTGKDADQRLWDEWCCNNIVRGASTVENYYYSFKHIIEVDPAKVYDPTCPFGWTYVKDFQQFAYPNRPLGSNTMCDWFRCEKDQWDHRWHINDFSGADHLFAATNNDADALMITLKYA
jgi:hypothetical protein